MDFASPSAQDVELTSYVLELKNKVESLEILSDWIAELSGQLEMSQRGIFRLELALVEAVTNIVQYAYDDEAEHEITVRLHCKGKVIQAEIEDDGNPFDPLQRPEVVLPTNLEDAREGGLGIHLIRSYADECAYRREANHNILTIVVCDSD